ncbi:MAG: SpoIIE family protein phosphatase [Muribaculaceae bacterium]|nr:SpoIIE family protein phosphatase [Muribaculaceae bacterium]
MFSYAGKVDIGVYEKQNDDRLLIGSHILTDGEFSDSTEKDYIVATVCDGVGGMVEGYRAAMIALETCSHLNRPGVTTVDIKEMIEVSNRRIRNIQSMENLQNGLRTTIAGIYADKEHFIVFNAGDSRVYRFRFKYFTQISKDHSLVQELIDIGEITPDEAKVHPKKNIINKCLGNEETVNPRIVDMSDDFAENDIVMICSDGISDEVLDAELKEILLAHKQDESLLECCRLIAQKAVEKGSKDNMSVILLRKGA